MFIPDPGSEFILSWVPDPGKKEYGSRIRIKEFKYRILNPKKSFKALRKIIWDVHPGSWIQIRIFFSIPDPESRGQKTTDP